MRAPTGSLPVVHGPLRARRRLRARRPGRLRPYPRVSRIRGRSGDAVHRRSTRSGPQGPRPGPRDRSPIRPSAGQTKMPRGTVASFPTHQPPCKHGSRLADASTGGISRFSTAPLGKAYCRWRPRPTGRDLSTSFQVGWAISRGPSTARPRKPGCAPVSNGLTPRAASAPSRHGRPAARHRRSRRDAADRRRGAPRSRSSVDRRSARRDRRRSAR